MPVSQGPIGLLHVILNLFHFPDISMMTSISTFPQPEFLCNEPQFYETDGKCIQNYRSKNLNGRDHSEDLGVDGRITVECTVGK